jgi:hypothetical protein
MKIMRPLVSSDISNVEYDTSEKTLTVYFHVGPPYMYIGVEFSVFNDLLNAPSHGKFFAENIKYGYHYKRLK